MHIVNRILGASVVIVFLMLSACGGSSGDKSKSNSDNNVNNNDGDEQLERTLTTAQLDPASKILPKPPSKLDASLRPPVSNL